MGKGIHADDCKQASPTFQEFLDVVIRTVFFQRDGGAHDSMYNITDFST